MKKISALAESFSRGLAKLKLEYVKRKREAEERRKKQALIRKKQQKHPFHLVDPSPWPMLVSQGAYIAVVGCVSHWQQEPRGFPVFTVGAMLMGASIFGWCRDII